MAGIALLVILLDLFVPRKGLLALCAGIGLILPLAFTISLCNTNEQAFANILLVDNFSIFFKFLFLGVTALVIMASHQTVSRFGRFQGEYYALILLASAGMMLLASTGELITLYLALELNTLSLIALIAFFKNNLSTEAGVKFLVLSAVSSAIMLYGIAMLFGLTGSTRLEEISAAMPVDRLLDNPTLLVGVILLVAGFGFKIASVPFHMWVPDVYQGAPTPITAFLSVASKAAGFAVIIRVFYLALGELGLEWSVIFAVLAVLSMTFGNLLAIVQSNIKRMLAYSTIAHAGYIMVGLAAVSNRTFGGSLEGPQGILFYLAAYALTNLAAFFVIIAVGNKLNSEEIDSYSGMGRRSPLLAALLAIALISLTGIPPTVGFWAKIYIFNAAIHADLVWLATAGVINSVISAYYYLRVVKFMYLNPSSTEENIPTSAPLKVALLATSGGVVIFGIIPGYLLDFAVHATQSLSN
ncbi:NADH-quinone oxidoreductase subunit N [Dehalococcoidia bacterium]|nr:NADH-quinone oxidoreductase subunit N [Dehalococcoidia bacterium]